MRLRRSLLVAVVALIAPPALAIDSRVKLPNALYNGSVLSNGITQWQVMRSVEPLVGRRCSRHPHDPEDENDMQSAQAHGDLCLITGFPVDDSGHGEGWLFGAVQVSSEAKEKANLPVFVYISGDGHEDTLAESYMNVMHLLESNGVNFIKTCPLGTAETTETLTSCL